MGILTKIAEKKFITAVLALVILLSLTTILLSVKRQDNDPGNAKTYKNFYADEAETGEDKAVPDDKQAALRHYNDLANSFYSAGNKAKALEYYLKAQLLIDETVQAEGYNYYRTIAELYRDTGNKPKAYEYYDKEISFTKALNNPEDHNYIAELEKARDRL